MPAESRLELPEPRELLPRILRFGEEYEFRTFLIGVHLPVKLPPEEKTRATRPLKERLGRMLEERYWPGRRVSFENPELQIQIDAASGGVSVVAASIFIAGRYRKFSRKISSSHWEHMACKGRGCPGCNFKGYLAEGSVGEIIGRPCQEAAGGLEYYFHAMGREDLDARMLGTGRPFVVEVAQPKRRSLDLGELRESINRKGQGRAEVAGPLYAVDASAVRVVKETEAEKSYYAFVATAQPLPSDTPRRVASLAGCVVEQETPTRVRHRRSCRLRKRKVLRSNCTVLDARTFIWEVRAEAGTYIKELATGDGGRTRPSLSDLLGVPAAVVELDVTAVHFEAPWERVARR